MQTTLYFLTFSILCDFVAQHFCLEYKPQFVLNEIPMMLMTIFKSGSLGIKQAKRFANNFVTKLKSFSNQECIDRDADDVLHRMMDDSTAEQVKRYFDYGSFINDVTL